MSDRLLVLRPHGSPRKNPREGWEGGESKKTNKKKNQLKIIIKRSAPAKVVEGAKRGARSAMLERDDLHSLLDKHGVSGVSIAVLCPDGSGDASVSTQCAGIADPNATPLFDSTLLQIASLSKPIASTFAAGYFADAGVSLDTPVADALAAANSPLRLRAAKGMPAEWAETVTLRQVSRS